MSKVLGELAENIAVDLSAGLGRIYGHCNFLRVSKRRVRAYRHQKETEKKRADDGCA